MNPKQKLVEKGKLLEPVIIIGKNGLTDSIIKEIKTQKEDENWEFLVAIDIDLLVTELDVDGSGLRDRQRAPCRDEDESAGGDRQAINIHRSTSYFNSNGDVLDPWTITWHVVQF